MSDVKRAQKLWRDFREEPVGRTRSVEIDIPRAAMVLGRCEFIGYVTTHKGKTYLYLHQFAKGSRPRLVAGTRRGQLLLVGGRFKVTDRGITDLDPAGRAVDAPERYKVIDTGR
jgi:hypothetical protein